MEIQVKSKAKPKKGIKLAELFKDYCSHASLHGIGYLGAKDRSLIEKIWWIIVFLVSLSACAFLISRTWTKWVNSPVIVSFAKEQTPLWEIPFPAVTICPLHKVQQNIYNYTKIFNERESLTGAERKFFLDVSLVCNLDYYVLHDQVQVGHFTDEETIQNIIKVASKDFIALVTWQFMTYYGNRSTYFTPILTAEGICFTSNSLNQKDMFTDELNHNIPFITHNRTNCGWDIENGYPKGLGLDVYPRRTGQDGMIAGLSIALKTNIKQIDYLCGIPVYGYKLILHNPAELPRIGQKYILIPLKKQVTIAVQPELLTTSNGLLSINSKIRNCYFSHEKSLKFFKIYTQSSCKMECLANVTKSHCGCVPFFLPRDNKTLICGFSQKHCYDSIEESLQHIEMSLREGTAPYDEENDTEYKIVKKCNCLPACSSLHFAAETSEAEGHFVKSALSNEESGLQNLTDIDESRNGNLLWTKVDVFFKDNHFIAVERSELYGQTDFFANCGGLLGLFLGFSILSIIEIVYYLTIRVYITLTQTKKDG